MAKRKVLKMSDEEVLKHYTSYDGQPLKSGPGAEEEQSLRSPEDIPCPQDTVQSDLKKTLDKALASKPQFIKAEIAVDHEMSKRKSAVINIIPPENQDK